MNTELRRSPLTHRKPVSDEKGRISLAERQFTGLLILRGVANALEKAVSTVTNLDLPATAGTFTDTPDNAAMWLGPDEWVIVTRPGTESGIMAALESELAGIHSQVVNVTDYYTAVTISGSASRDVLAKTTMIDLYPGSFSRGNAVASLFGHAGAWLQMVSDESDGEATFALYVRRSMADYIWCLLADAGREFGLEPQKPIGRVKLHLPHFETT